MGWILSKPSPLDLYEGFIIQTLSYKSLSIGDRLHLSLSNSWKMKKGRAEGMHSFPISCYFLRPDSILKPTRHQLRPHTPGFPLDVWHSYHYEDIFQGFLELWHLKTRAETKYTCLMTSRCHSTELLCSFGPWDEQEGPAQRIQSMEREPEQHTFSSTVGKCYIISHNPRLVFIFHFETGPH